jgi:hypothetical protein
METFDCIVVDNEIHYSGFDSACCCWCIELLNVELDAWILQSIHFDDIQQHIEVCDKLGILGAEAADVANNVAVAISLVADFFECFCSLISHLIRANIFH